ncbi:hypothetical protein GGG16DRAFT_113813 [Schizophyllum commune]
MVHVQIFTFSYDDSMREVVKQATHRLQGLDAKYLGQQIEDNSLGYCVLQWKSDVDVIEDHEVASLLKARGKTFELTTITVDNEEDIDELRTLLSLPVQEFTAATLKSSYKRSDWEEAVNTLRSDKGTGKVSGFLSVVLGQDVRNSEGYVLLSGWNSYEEADMAQKRPEAGYNEDMLAAVDIRVKHANVVMSA